nr:hypothetical protein [Tanacetum cinerariifolium]
MEDPDAATESSGTSSTIEKSPLDFDNENPSQQITEMLRKDHAASRPTQSTMGGKSLASTGLEAGFTFFTPTPQETPAGVSDLDPLLYAMPPSIPDRDIVQSSHGAAIAGDPDSEKSSSFTPDMDLFNLISAPNPTKVKISFRPCVAHEVPLLTATASRVVDMEDPDAATESSGTSSTIEKSPLDFDNENPSQQITEEVGVKEEIAAMGPPLSKKRRKMGNNGVDENVSPKMLRKDHVASRPTESTMGGKSLASTGLEAGFNFFTPTPQETPANVSDLDHLLYAMPPSIPDRDIALPYFYFVVDVEADMKKAVKAKNADLTKELESLRTQFSTSVCLILVAMLTEDVLLWPGNANMAFDLWPTGDVLPWPGNANMTFDLRPTKDVLLWPDNANMAFDLRITEDVLSWPGNANMAFDLRPTEDVLPWPDNANMAFDLRITEDVLSWPGNANMAFGLRLTEDVLPWPGSANMVFGLLLTEDVLS